MFGFQTGYDPKNTFINEGQLQYWLKNKVSADLESVPGVGPANKHHFVNGITALLQFRSKNKKFEGASFCLKCIFF